MKNVFSLLVLSLVLIFAACSKSERTPNVPNIVSVETKATHEPAQNQPKDSVFCLTVVSVKTESQLRLMRDYDEPYKAMVSHFTVLATSNDGDTVKMVYRHQGKTLSGVGPQGENEYAVNEWDSICQKSISFLKWHINNNTARLYCTYSDRFKMRDITAFVLRPLEDWEEKKYGKTQNSDTELWLPGSGTETLIWKKNGKTMFSKD